MAKVLEKRMTVAEFLTWADARPEGRYELVRGEIFAMAPERARHALTKHRIARALEDAVSAAALDCIVFPDGMMVAVDEHIAYEPDAVVQCGQTVDMDSTLVKVPLIVVEVLSPNNASIDMSEKLVDYFRVPSIIHYLVVDSKRRAITHHQRGSRKGEVHTRILTEGELSLDPPGLKTVVAELFLPE